MDRKWSFTGQDKRCWLNERWNLNAGKQQEGEAQIWKEDTANWTKGHLTERVCIQSKERMRKQKVEKPYGQKVRTDWKKCDSNEWWRKVFIKDEPISNVGKLIDDGSIQLKNWRKQIRKERNYQSRRFNSFNEFDSIERKSHPDLKYEAL